MEFVCVNIHAKSIPQKEMAMKIQLFVENAIQTNCWVVIDEETQDAIIIDLGGGYKKILEYIEEQNAKLKFILCTHGHFDHIMGIAEMQKENVFIPVYMSEKDFPMTSQINNMLKMFGMGGDYPNVKVEGFIDENSDLTLGKYKIQVIETPGHTQGGLCFKIGNYLFSGDSLFYREIGRCDLPGGNYNTLISSLKNKLAKLPDETIVYPGHGCVTNIKDEKKYNPYLQ